ncbi:unnamed protein product, partial [Soboliphyme baturini]|uniref:protein-tyrosine-phosphatase n=1 Tax=Soboliphyme baturini TaxID=241478 RepID=A0A183ILH9_9BILA
DHTRIILEDNESSSPGFSDYINANLIKPIFQVLPEYEMFAGISRSYISTQGCLPNTVDDFWRMIWQKKCSIIVMTTKEMERGKVVLASLYPNTRLFVRCDSVINHLGFVSLKSKCARYWSCVGQQKVCGLNKELTIVTVSEETCPDYTLRTLSVKRNVESKATEERTIYQYQFLAWPDHGVPSDPSSVLNFLEEVDRRAATIKDCGPVVVHCSAGIGRTGAFIAIDLILNSIKRNGLQCIIDIRRTVEMLRSQRSGMVQTEAQYKFVYLAVQHYIDILAKHLQEQKRSEVLQREYTNIRYTSENANFNLSPTSTTLKGNDSQCNSFSEEVVASNAAALEKLHLQPPPRPKRLLKQATGTQ